MVITQRLADAMIAHARHAFPNEACGLVAVQSDRAVEFFPIDNADASPVHYRMDPQQQLHVMTQIEDRGWELGGIFHSHTRTRAFPSETDIELAFFPDTLYVIASLANDVHPDLRAFRIRDRTVEEESIRIVG